MGPDDCHPSGSEKIIRSHVPESLVFETGSKRALPVVEAQLLSGSSFLGFLEHGRRRRCVSTASPARKSSLPFRNLHMSLTHPPLA
jgi:hypothetical protein